MKSRTTYRAAPAGPVRHPGQLRPDTMNNADPAVARFEPFRVLLGTLLALILSALFASSSMVDIAERMEFGPARDRWLLAAQTVDDASHNLYTDRPADWLRSALGYDDAPDTVILGELAVANAPQEMAAAETDPDLVENSVPAGSDGEGDGATREPAAEPEPEPELREITEDQPLRVWMGGDSLGQFIAGHIAYRVAPPERTDLKIDYHISTGLARPDYFDWPAHFTDLAAGEPRPEAFVFMVGGNDDQAMRLQSAVLDPATPEWREEYRRRVGLLMDVVAYPDARLIWILLPPMQDTSRETITQQINDVVRSQAGLRPWVSVIELQDLLSNGDGRYAQFVEGPQGGQHLARQNDGVHMTEVGSQWVAERVWAELSTLWPTVMPPPDTPTASQSTILVDPDGEPTTGG
ncbi:MAG: DUF459 domain-containing protein [Acidimicrobiales bacterium]|nr:DUF459 domain-containing protein [Acidimicrobiales bacterium]